jgi:anti-sigma B factor antagonist
VDNYSVDVKGDTAHVILAGELDVATAPAVSQAIRAGLATQAPRILIDLDAVTFVDSAALHAIVSGYHAAVRVGAGFGIGPVAPNVARVLALTGLADRLTAEPTETR